MEPDASLVSPLASFSGLSWPAAWSGQEEGTLGAMSASVMLNLDLRPHANEEHREFSLACTSPVEIMNSGGQVEQLVPAISGEGARWSF